MLSLQLKQRGQTESQVQTSKHSLDHVFKMTETHSLDDRWTCSSLRLKRVPHSWLQRASSILAVVPRFSPFLWVFSTEQTTLQTVLFDCPGSGLGDSQRIYTQSSNVNTQKTKHTFKKKAFVAWTFSSETGPYRVAFQCCKALQLMQRRIRPFEVSSGMPKQDAHCFNESWLRASARRPGGCCSLICLERTASIAP